MNPLSTQSVTKAVIVVPAGASPDNLRKRYGGETLLGRSLVVLSKSGFRHVVIIGEERQKIIIEKIVRSVSHRLKFNHTFAERISGAPLNETILKSAEQWNESFILFECGKIIHPTLISQMTGAEAADPVLFTFKEVWADNGRAVFSDKIKSKFKIIFQDIRLFFQASADKGKLQAIIQSGYNDDKTVFSLGRAGALPEGFISTQIILCKSGHLKDVHTAEKVDDIISDLAGQGGLRLRWVDPAWWVPVGEETPHDQIKEMFWKIAFKEISGEFSKAVNSHLSKPMTFLLVRLRFTPNVISVIEIVLFLISSVFLFVPGYWGMAMFAVIWQLSAGVLDRCDGEVARMRNYESASGARFDMLIDDLRFAIPLLALGYVCWNTEPLNWLYPGVLVATLLWYIPAALYQQYYMRKAGYVSIQALGVDLLKSLEHEVSPDGFFNRYRFLLKGDIRTFYVFLLSLAGFKPVVFFVLALYEWLVGLTNIITVQKMKRVMKHKLESR